MDQFTALKAFVSVVEKGSFSAASDHLGYAKSSVSKRVSELERQLGVLLLQRTTRKISLTEPGNLYYQQAKQILDDLLAANESVSSLSTNLKGSLKLAASLSFGLRHLTPLINEFMHSHPELMIDLDLNDRQVDIIEDGFDLVIRIGQLPDSSLIARRLAPIHLLACASPEYLAKQGMPEQPTDLLHHQFLAYSNTNKNRKFYDDQGNSYEVSPTPSLRANNGDVLMESAIQGHGITILPTFILHKEIKKGRLVPVMTKYKAPSLSAYAIYPNNRFLSSKVRHMIDFLATKLEGIPYWDKDCG